VSGGGAHLEQGGSDEWYTPAPYIEAARQALGAIDLDPASNLVAQAVVGAGTYYTKDDDGLAQPWAGRVWINPPYSNPRPWVERLVDQYEAGAVEAGLILVNNATDTAWFQRLLARYPACFFGKRISFWRADRGVLKGNRQGQALFYLGPDPIRFAEAFADMGQIVNLPATAGVTS
jgi:phage N-6-adenine-methyltransferase